MNEKFGEGHPLCPSCGGPMRKTTFKLVGHSLRGWKCPKDGQELIHPADAQKALAANKLKYGVKLRIGVLNKAPYVRFTKEFSTLLRKGGRAIAAITAPNEIRLKIVK